DNGSGVAKTFYSIDGSEYTEGTSFSVTSEGIHKISFYSVDLAGNSEEPKTVEVKQDKTAPVTTSNVYDGWSKDDATVNLTATDNGSGVAKTFYSIDGSEYTEGTSFSITGEGTHKVSFYSVDLAGNSEEPKTVEVKQDKTAPVTTSNVADGWFKDNATVNLTATDNGSGVAKTFYSIDGSEYTEGTSFSITGEGTHKVSFYSIDLAGNAENAKTIELSEDKLAPTTTSNTSEEWTKNDVSVNLTATDSESGVAKTFYSIDGANYTEGTSFTVTEAGTHKITFYSVDNAGNTETEKTSYVKIDKIAPVTTSNVSKSYTDKFKGCPMMFSGFNCMFEGYINIAWFNFTFNGYIGINPHCNKDSMLVNLTATDSESGVAKTFYSIDGADYIEGTSFNITGEGAHKITFYSVDNAGNIEETKTTYVTTDKTAPVTTSNIDCEWHKDNVDVDLAAVDNGSGVAKTFYSIDDSDYLEGTSFTVTEEGIHKITFYSVDVSGNTEKIKTAYVKIDKTAPTIEMNLANEYNLGSVLPTYKSSDNLSGIANEKMVVFKPDETTGKVITNDTDFILDKLGTYKVNVTVTDYAGLSTTIEKTFSVKKGPELSDKDIQVLSRDDWQMCEFNNTLYPRIKIRNVSNKDINLSDMQIKYFFTNEGNGESIFDCDWAGLNWCPVTESVKGNFARDNAGNTALTISFQSNRKLKPGQELEIQGRIHDPNWKIYNRFNDYSLNTWYYSKNDRISVYYDNTKVYGTEPNLETKDDNEITSNDFTLLSEDANQQAQYNNTLYPRIKIKNISNKKIRFSDMKLMYFFTSDENTKNIFACDYLAVNNRYMPNNIKGDFSLDSSGNTAMTLSFNDDGKIFMPGDEIEIQGRIYNSNWRLYNRFNDYSLNTKDYSPNNRICFYVKGINVNGITP
ncbi:hypothetical protein NNC19_09150, partial [Clostridium sp. SHJSY1]|uniref:OmpL47-type beta-barrel domain-containing protein n=1 Tax=Clostridium sp. SHJSY1 TaxID=2942483 RepID=UPI00287709A3